MQPPRLRVCSSCPVEALGLPDKLGTVLAMMSKAVLLPPWSDLGPPSAVRPGSVPVLVHAETWRKILAHVPLSPLPPDCTSFVFPKNQGHQLR